MAPPDLAAVAAEVIGPPGRAVPAGQEAGDTYLPGYTHLQRAQPVLLAHHLLAHGWALAARRGPLWSSDRPTGCVPARGRGPGRVVPASGPRVAWLTSWASRAVRELARRRVGSGFRRRGPVRPGPARGPPLPHGRGAGAVVHRGVRLRVLDDAYATGSSMLPQKKNPDVAELARGKAGRLSRAPDRVAGDLEGPARSPTTVICRRTRSPCSTRSSRSRLALRRSEGPVHVDFRQERVQAAADGPAAAAVDLAEMLVEQGMPFRQAHAMVAAWSATPSSATSPCRSWSAPTPTGRGRGRSLEPGVAVTRRTSPGAAGPGPVPGPARAVRPPGGIDRNRIGDALTVGGSGSTMEP